MADLFSQRAKFEDVVLNDEALMFHYINFESGQRYTLARLCYQYIQSKK
jgi:hypothetical protein